MQKTRQRVIAATIMAGLAMAALLLARSTASAGSFTSNVQYIRDYDGNKTYESIAFTWGGWGHDGFGGDYVYLASVSNYINIMNQASHFSCWYQAANGPSLIPIPYKNGNRYSDYWNTPYSGYRSWASYPYSNGNLVLEANWADNSSYCGYLMPGGGAYVEGHIVHWSTTQGAFDYAQTYTSYP